MPIKKLIPFQQVDDAKQLTVAQLMSLMHNERVLVLQPTYEPYHRAFLHQVEARDAAFIDVLAFNDEADFLAQLSLYPQGRYSDIIGFNFIHQLTHTQRAFHLLSACLRLRSVASDLASPFCFCGHCDLQQKAIALEVCSKAVGLWFGALFKNFTESVVSHCKACI